MAKRAKTTEKKTTKIVEEGVREEGEEVPVDDSHITMEGTPSIDAEPELELESGQDPTPSAPEEVEVVIGGQLYNMSPEAAMAYQNEQVSQQSTRDAAPIQEETKEPGDGPNYEEILFTDPNEALRLHGEAVAKQVTETLTNQYSTNQAQQRFWDDFYSENGELKEDDHIVRMVLTQHFDVLENMSGKAARDKLAELTQTEILRLVNKQGGTNQEGNESTSLEGGTSEQSGVATVAPTPKTPQTLGQAIKERRMKQQRPMGSQGQG
jgi:hypothetical protein